MTSRAQEGVLRLHPELGSKQVVKGTEVALSQYSEGEQRGAGLLQLAEAEQLLISELNVKYRALTSFPFVVCVTEVAGGLSGVVNELQRRLSLLAPGDDGPAPSSLVDEERRQAIRAVALICSKRIRRLVDDISSNHK
ncbi:hypothetical protein B566_EDAN000905 [Ephemera danica]|nr:hypothetical protein B566_EDAN000905 [Ephemera danica]